MPLKPYLVEALFDGFDPCYVGEYHTLYMALAAARRPVRVMEQFVIPKEIQLVLHCSKIEGVE